MGRDYAAENRAKKVDQAVGVLEAVAVRTGTSRAVVYEEWVEILRLVREENDPTAVAAVETLERICRFRPGRGFIGHRRSFDLFEEAVEETLALERYEAPSSR